MIFVGDESGLVKRGETKTNKFGQVDKKQAISNLLPYKNNVQNSGLVELIDMNGDIEKQWEFENNGFPFIGAHVYEDIVNDECLKFDLGKDLRCLSGFEENFAVAGKERCVNVYSILEILKTKLADPFWKAKNVKHDKLNIRVAVDISCMSFINKHTIATGTLNSEIGDVAFKAIACTENVIAVSDTIGSIYGIAPTTGARIWTISGLPGCISCLFIKDESIYAASIDRHARVIDLATRKVLKKQRLTSICVANEETDIDADDKVWEEIPDIKETSARKKVKVK
ncbi:hypothetical protein ROZALSC1DRAFT_26977 [Rozella allomycis CSF55]|uniref:Uncharacterized protein n=1 Tax=Rozella allomycis (strain CSF55) TaxID=988480 RepID=A0A4P9YQ03_ROZAC|nr:hypothetical protein ROZALSC1DRAFT_26977 [Rozella allomycis CSF55]